MMLLRNRSQRAMDLLYGGALVSEVAEETGMTEAQIYGTQKILESHAAPHLNNDIFKTLWALDKVCAWDVYNILVQCFGKGMTGAKDVTFEELEPYGWSEIKQKIPKYADRHRELCRRMLMRYGMHCTDEVYDCVVTTGYSAKAATMLARDLYRCFRVDTLKLLAKLADEDIDDSPLSDYMKTCIRRTRKAAKEKCKE